MEETAKKELKDYASQLRELGKEIQTSFSGPLVSDSGVGSSCGFCPRAQSLLVRSQLSCGVCASNPPLSIPSKA